MINNRQAGRRRGRGGGNGQRPGGNPGRPDSGNRIDNRARGNANQLYEKYKNLARDAHQQGDRVNTEYYLQFADHYFRVLNENRSRFEDGQQQQRRPRDFVNGFEADFDGDEEYADEGEPIRAGEQGDQTGAEPRREGQPRDAERGGFDRQRDRRERRDEVRRDEGRRDEGRRNGQANGHEVASAGEPIEARPLEVANDVDAAQAGEGRRRGRPRRERPVESDASVAIEADRLPPALSVGSDADAISGEEPKPRRRRARPAQDEAPAA